MLPQLAQRHSTMVSRSRRYPPAALAMVLQGGLGPPPPWQVHRLQVVARSGRGGRPAAQQPRRHPRPRLQSRRQPRRNTLQGTGNRRPRLPQQAGASATGGAPPQSAAARAHRLGRPAAANPAQVPPARRPRRPPWSSGPLAAALRRRTANPPPRRSPSACPRSACSMRRRSCGLRLGARLARRRAPWHASRRRRPQAKPLRRGLRWRLTGRRRGGPRRPLHHSSRLRSDRPRIGSQQRQQWDSCRLGCGDSSSKSSSHSSRAAVAMQPCHPRRRLASSRGLRSWTPPRWRQRRSSGCSRSPPAAASAVPHLSPIPGTQPTRRQPAVAARQLRSLPRRSGGRRRGTTPRSLAAALPRCQRQRQCRRRVPRSREHHPRRHGGLGGQGLVRCSRRSRLLGRLRRPRRPHRSPQPEQLRRRCSSRSTRPSDRSAAHLHLQARPRSSPALAQRLAARMRWRCWRKWPLSAIRCCSCSRGRSRTRVHHLRNATL